MSLTDQYPKKDQATERIGRRKMSVKVSKEGTRKEGTSGIDMLNLYDCRQKRCGKVPETTWQGIVKSVLKSDGKRLG